MTIGERIEKLSQAIRRLVPERNSLRDEIERERTRANTAEALLASITPEVIQLSDEALALAEEIRLNGN